SLVGVTVIVAIAHYLSGGIRLQSPGEKVTPQVKAHLSVLLGLIFLVKAWGYYLGRFDLLVSSRGVVTGASYTDVHVQKSALYLLVFIAVACALLFLVNIRVRGWPSPSSGSGSWRSPRSSRAPSSRRSSRSSGWPRRSSRR